MLKKIHFVGIGGIGMSGIAEILINLGNNIQGSDIASNENTERLEKLGATIFKENLAQNIQDVDILVISSAIKSDNPEIMAAKQLRIPIISRAHILAELMQLQIGIAITGSHGKTTTTSLISLILEQAGLDPTIINGGNINFLNSNVRHGNGKYIIVEADESDGSFLLLKPNTVVVTNLDEDHLDYWTGGLKQMKNAFVKFLNNIPLFGLIVLCIDSDAIREIIPFIKRNIVTYGIHSNAEYTAKNIVQSDTYSLFELFKNNNFQGLISLQITGEHNIQNALAAIAVADKLGISLNIIQQSLEFFNGVKRRFTKVGEKNGILIIDDYGHHPVEIQVVLKSAKHSFKNRRIIVLFQPHRYTRTRDMFRNFTKAFNNADLLIVSDIYAAGENPISGINSKELVRNIKIMGHNNVYYGGDLDASTNIVINSLTPNDVIITLGAGTVTMSAYKILELI